MPRHKLNPLPQPVFDEASFLPDPATFSTSHPSSNAIYQQIHDLLLKDVVDVPASRAAPGDLFALEQVFGANGPATLARIAAAGKIIFHATGDSGASNVRYYPNELSLADQLALDVHTADNANRPTFLFHLGDLVYDFGESKYYYDQFYEPFRNYPAPIFAIAGNHDSFVVPGTATGDQPLEIFLRNFCAAAPTITQEAGSLHRTAMTQPGVYYTLESPFVRIIALFSNALEDPGVISSESGVWPHVSDVQLEFLAAQLARVRTEQYAGALLLATHHPPFSYSPPAGGSGAGGNHGGSTTMQRQIDAICAEQQVYPHAFLAGHAHNYQRYSRTIDFGAAHAYQVPFIVCGNGGHHVNRLVQANKGQPAVEPHPGADVSYLDLTPAVKAQGMTLEKYDDLHFGYLRVTVDAHHLKIAYHQAGAASLAQSRFDLVTIALASHRKVGN